MSRPNIIPCASCGLENNILSRKQAKEFNCFNCGADLQLAIQNYDKLQKNAENKRKNKISYKYSVLDIYKGLVFLLMIVITGYFIYSFVQFAVAPNAITTVSYFITMFSLYCLTKIIDFLFDLDKYKSDKE